MQHQTTDFWSSHFCRILTELGGMYKQEQSRAPCTQTRHGFIKCTFIIVYNDDDMTECTDDDSCYLNGVDLFLNLLLGSNIRMLKKSIIILIF